jgi:hypothetical protein
VPFTLIPFSAMNSVVNLMLSPVCYQFPSLRFVFSEAGIGWVPAVLERVDRVVERNAYHVPPPGDLKPSEIFRRNMFVCMLDEHFGFANADAIGIEQIVVETDYPHSDTSYPHTQKAFGEIFDGHPADVVDAVTYENAERIFNWTIADRGLLTAPDVSSWRATLEEDPFAAMKAPRGDAGSQAVTHLDSTGLCRHVVVHSGGIRDCNKPIGSDGRCSAGHLSTTA